MRTAFDTLAPFFSGLPVPQVQAPDDQATPQRYRTVFISDLHLGTPGCQAVELFTHKTRTDAHRFYDRLGFEQSHVGYRIKL